jgi:hypothetical protein
MRKTIIICGILFVALSLALWLERMASSGVVPESKYATSTGQDGPDDATSADGGIASIEQDEVEEVGSETATPILKLADIPEGKFRTALMAIPSDLREKVLVKISELEIPENDFDSLGIHPSGRLFYVCDFGGGLPIARTDRQEAGKNIEAMAVVESIVFTNTVPISSPPLFHSRPGATNVLFLDFNGHLVTNTAWNSYPDWNEPLWDCRPYSIDADETTFSAAEQQAILTIWERVAEDYAPFDIDVTTEQPVAWSRYVGHVLITPGTDKNGVSCPHDGYGGIAFVDVFGEVNYSYDYAGESFSPAWVLNYELAGYAEYEAEAASHEMGHNLELSHDGTKKAAYYDGHENGSIGWAPIMGAGYDRDSTQWSKGDYRLSNNTEDDLSILATQLSYRPDDFGDDHISADSLAVGPTGSVYQTGVVETYSDTDVFRFVAESGTVDITVSPYRDSASTTWGGNLDVVLELYDDTETLLATNNPTLETTASLTAVVSNGVYYLHIKSTGVGDPFKAPSPTGYVSYGSIGQYAITGSFVINIDLDSDGLPNDWEIEYFGGMTNAVATVDSDGDGADNLTEYISGHHPINSTSVFAITSYTLPTTGDVPFIVEWDPVAGRVYSVGWSDDLIFTPFTNISGDLSYPAGSYTDAIPRIGPKSFYQVDVRLEE